MHMKRFNTTLAAVGATLAMGMGNAHAITNYVTNGSFEANGGSLTGWTIGGTDGQGFPPVAITYNSASGYPTGAFGEAVPPNNAFTNSPDPVGTHAAYFVTDLARPQTLSQNVFLAAGEYQIGFSAYLPLNGFNNANDATFSGSIAGTTLANFTVSTGTAQQWKTFAGSTTIAADGLYLIEFIFNSFGVPAKDVVIDQVYVIEGNPPNEVPEPSTYALMLAGLGMLGLMARRRMQQ
jgi:hypothetical protein